MDNIARYAFEVIKGSKYQVAYEQAKQSYENHRNLNWCWFDKSCDVCIGHKNNIQWLGTECEDEWNMACSEAKVHYD